MSSPAAYTAIVIGSGSAGLTVAQGLVGLGRRVVLVESGPIGDDCTNVGCIPSKTLLHQARSGGHTPWAGTWCVAVGDVTGAPATTHGANAMARRVVQAIGKVADEFTRRTLPSLPAEAASVGPQPPAPLPATLGIAAPTGGFSQP